ncbi:MULTISPECIES: hypothetical protein [Flavobacterium]|uniref:Lipoprotein n=1 Tax=Flavobacterium covae TaxID=2906076 RepID=A0ABW8PFR9_9FLAO|nr:MULTISPECIES: hypothetical protein [Flavobacterium]OXA83408.1 hypothetical protein B0A56_01555 [Flavobacterium columnare NBRC 100251 = ATCC 23463]AMA48319.1 hypothetical protein AWN65_01960 [Flavobacterium covae]AND63519.1 hypothetical protein AX766_03405 [Flavobacterium covae]MCJ1808453.1 hypothetical protein [Flavobacterium covae]OWP82241.1 hypothetical protein BWK63_01985 [Flavobacterium covae]
MKKTILLLSSLVIISCKSDKHSNEKTKDEKVSSIEDTLAHINQSEENISYMIPSEKEAFPFIIDQKVYDKLSNSDSQYTFIKDINTINKLLTPKYKKELISLNNNPKLLDDYSFVKIAERKFKNFKITFFSALYHGDGDFIATFANVTKENSSEIIDSRKVCDYYDYMGGTKLAALVMDKNGKIEITTTVDKKKPSIESLRIDMDGKIISSK